MHCIWNTTINKFINKISAGEMRDWENSNAEAKYSAYK